jgi:hypothetical protein
MTNPSGHAAMGEAVSSRRFLHYRQLLDHGPPRRPQVGPRFDYNLTQQAFADIEAKKPTDKKLVDAFKSYSVDPVLAACARLRPTVDTFVE